MNNNNIMARKISYGGILLAFNSLFFLLVNYIPTNTISLLATSSLLISILVIEFDIKTSLIYWLASVIFAFIILNNKLHFIGYALVLSNYGIIKYVIESSINQKNWPIEYLIKILYSLLVFVIMFFISKAFIKIDFKFLYLLIFLVLYIVYDYVYTQFIIFYSNKIKNKLNQHKK